MKFDYKALSDIGESVGFKSVREQCLEAFWSNDIAKRNALLTESIELAIGRPPGTLPRLNPYDYIKRLTRAQRADGELIRLDGKPILFLGLTQIGGDGFKITGTFHYECMVGKS